MRLILSSLLALVASSTLSGSVFALDKAQVQGTFVRGEPIIKKKDWAMGSRKIEYAVSQSVISKTVTMFNPNDKSAPPEIFRCDLAYAVPERLTVGQPLSLTLAAPNVQWATLGASFEAKDCCPQPQTCDAQPGKWTRFCYTNNPDEQSIMSAVLKTQDPRTRGTPPRSDLEAHFVFQPKANATPEIFLHVDRVFDDQGVDILWKYKPQ